MASFSTIRAKIKTALTSITELVFVYDYHEPNLGGYPSVTFDVAENSGAFLTNKENMRTISFDIVIYQEITVKGLDEATNILDTAADKIVTVFESPTYGDLQSEVDWCIPLAGPRGTFQSPQGLVLFQRLSLQCRFHYTP
jgi:hypothetical protein